MKEFSSIVLIACDVAMTLIAITIVFFLLRSSNRSVQSPVSEAYSVMSENTQNLSDKKIREFAYQKISGARVIDFIRENQSISCWVLTKETTGKDCLLDRSVYYDKTSPYYVNPIHSFFCYFVDNEWKGDVVDSFNEGIRVIFVDTKLFSSTVSLEEARNLVLQRIGYGTTPSDSTLIWFRDDADNLLTSNARLCLAGKKFDELVQLYREYPKDSGELIRLIKEGRLKKEYSESVVFSDLFVKEGDYVE